MKGPLKDCSLYCHFLNYDYYLGLFKNVYKNSYYYYITNWGFKFLIKVSKASLYVSHSKNYINSEAIWRYAHDSSSENSENECTILSVHTKY